MDGAGTRGTPTRSGIAVFSGGTGGNSLVDVFNKIIERRKCHLNYIIPISDNGGSSSELIRFIGGPSVGDIRSRLVRLIPNPEGDEEMAAIKSLFEYRLCPDRDKARAEWLDIVEGRHLLWAFISSQKRELIRSVLNTLNLEIVKRARPTNVFNFGEASVGNMFLTGARLFSGSFESAIYLLSMICAIPTSISVLPAINSNFTHHICAGLSDGTQITGQVAISHPSTPSALPDDDPTTTFSTTTTADAGAPGPVTAPATIRRRRVDSYRDGLRHEDASLPGSLPALSRRHVGFSKAPAAEADLPARIERIWYINPYGHEIWPVANPKVLAALACSRAVVYSVGSLYTSIVPSLVLRGVGRALADPGLRARVLVLNCSADRETGPRAHPMTGADFVAAVARAAGGEAAAAGGGAASYVTHLVYAEGPAAPAVDVEGLRRIGVECVRVEGRVDGEGALRYEEGALGAALEEIIMDS